MLNSRITDYIDRELKKLLRSEVFKKAVRAIVMEVTKDEPKKPISTPPTVTKATQSKNKK